MTSARMGDASDTRGSYPGFTSTLGPASPCSVFCTSAAAVPGKIRQLTVAVADWGSAFSAWPPASMVATQVVRILPTNAGTFEISAAAAALPGSAAKRVMAAPSGPAVADPPP